MKEEVDTACEFLCSNIRSNNYTNISQDQMENFRTVLKELIVDKFTNHWYPEKPLRGNGFRCINIDKDTQNVDPVLEKAAEVSNISKDLLLSTFRSGLALWVDPGDVSYRTGRSPAVISLYQSEVTTIVPETAKATPVLPVKTPPTYSNGFFVNGFSQLNNKNILSSYPQLTAKKLKQLLRQRQHLDRYLWTNADYIHKRVTEVY